jgi:single-strand DNA-binding protein
MNQVLLEGHSGKDCEVTTTQGGLNIATLSIATSEGKDDKKKTEWHRVKVFGYGVQGVKDIKKGDRIILRGKISYGEYEKNGQKVYSTDIIAYSVAKLPKSPRDAANKAETFARAPIEDDSIPFGP